MKNILAGVFFQALQALNVYHPLSRGSRYFVAIGLVLSTLTSIFWLKLARSHKPEELIFLGVLWDASVMAVFLFVPLCLFGVRLSPWATAGLALTALGLVLMKF